MRKDDGQVVDRNFKYSLANERVKVTERAFENYEFGSGVRVEASNGWMDEDTNDWLKIVFVHFDDDGPNEPTHKVSFHVTFANDIDSILQDVYALVVENGNEIGF